MNVVLGDETCFRTSFVLLLKPDVIRGKTRVAPPTLQLTSAMPSLLRDGRGEPRPLYALCATLLGLKGTVKALKKLV